MEDSQEEVVLAPEAPVEEVPAPEVVEDQPPVVQE